MAYSLDMNAWDESFARVLFETVDFTSLIQVGALPSLNAGDIESMSIMMPPIEEQRIIGTYFNRFETRILFEQSTLETLQKTRNGLLQRLFI